MGTRPSLLHTSGPGWSKFSSQRVAWEGLWKTADPAWLNQCVTEDFSLLVGMTMQACLPNIPENRGRRVANLNTAWNTKQLDQPGAESETFTAAVGAVLERHLRLLLSGLTL